MFNNNSQENSKAFEQSVDLLANILVDIIDNARTDNIGTSTQKDIIKVNNKNKYEKNQNLK